MFTILENEDNKEAVEKFYNGTLRHLVEVFHIWERDVLKTDSEIESQENWNQFIYENCLQDFVVVDEDENFGTPISLKTGMAIDRELTQEYNPMPETLTECETFF